MAKETDVIIDGANQIAQGSEQVVDAIVIISKQNVLDKRVLIGFAAGAALMAVGFVVGNKVKNRIHEKRLEEALAQVVATGEAEAE